MVLLGGGTECGETEAIWTKGETATRTNAFPRHNFQIMALARGRNSGCLTIAAISKHLALILVARIDLPLLVPEAAPRALGDATLGRHGLGFCVEIQAGRKGGSCRAGFSPPASPGWAFARSLSPVRRIAPKPRRPATPPPRRFTDGEPTSGRLNPLGNAGLGGAAGVTAAAPSAVRQ